MKQRTLGSIAASAAFVVGAIVAVAGQAPSAPTQAGSAIRTAWGDPDLQGIWDTTPVQIPLQRPAKFKDQEFFTAEQVAELDKVRAGLPGNETRSVRGTEQDVAGAYNAVFTSRKPTGRRTSLIIDPPDGRLPPVTPQVMERRRYIRDFSLALLEATDTCKNKMPGCEGGKYTGVVSPRRNEPYKYYPNYRINRMDHPEDHGTLNSRCMGGNIPDFTGFRQIVQAPDAVSIHYDVGQGQGFHRVIPLTDRPHQPAAITSWWGDSVGHWEGNTLVVDATNFSAKQDFMGSSGEKLHLTERWTRTGPETIEYVVRIEDPTAWTKPWTVKQEFALQSAEANRIYKEPRCVEGNYGMIAMLAGARAQELAYAEGRGPDPATTNFATPTNSANQLSAENGDEDTDPLQ